MQQQNSISAKGLDADFVIQYDVDLRDLLGDVQVGGASIIDYCISLGISSNKLINLFDPLFSFLLLLRCMMGILHIILHPEGFLWFLRMSFLSLMSVAP